MHATPMRPGLLTTTARPCVLVVDDDADVRGVLARAIERIRPTWEVVALAGADEALDVLRERRIALLICDQRMPGKLGIELIQHAKSYQPDLSCILITGHADLELALRAINDAGVARLVTKPFSPKALAHEATRFVEGPVPLGLASLLAERADGRSSP